MKNVNESRIRMKQLKSWIERFEETPMYAQYRTYLSMNSLDKKSLWNEWDEYYKRVRETKIGRLLQKQREAFSQGNFGRAVEIAKWVKDNSNTALSDAPKKPVFGDPYETIYKVSHYTQKKSEYENLKQFFSDIGEKDDVLL